MQHCLFYYTRYLFYVSTYYVVEDNDSCLFLVSIGRFFIYTVANSKNVHEIYTISSGLYICWLCTRVCIFEKVFVENIQISVISPNPSLVFYFSIWENEMRPTFFKYSGFSEWVSCDTHTTFLLYLLLIWAHMYSFNTWHFLSIVVQLPRTYFIVSSH